MKFLVQHGHHNEKAQWVVSRETEHDTKDEARAHMEVHSARLTEFKNPKVVENIKMVDTGEDNPNKLPKIYHYISSASPGLWIPGDMV